MSKENSDRRRFFRIDDRLKLNLVRLSELDAATAAGAGFHAEDVLQDIDRRINLIISAARVQAPAVAELAELLNRKLNHVIDTLRLNEELAQRAVFREYELSLSACGIGMVVAQSCEDNEKLMLELMFPPNDTLLRMMVRVVRCLPQNAGGYLLHLDFVDIGEEDQEFLIQYIVRRQSAFLQHLRDERRASPVQA